MSNILKRPFGACRVAGAALIGFMRDPAGTATTMRQHVPPEHLKAVVNELATLVKKAGGGTDVLKYFPEFKE